MVRGTCVTRSCRVHWTSARGRLLMRCTTMPSREWIDRLVVETCTSVPTSRPMRWNAAASRVREHGAGAAGPERGEPPAFAGQRAVPPREDAVVQARQASVSGALVDHPARQSMLLELRASQHHVLPVGEVEKLQVARRALDCTHQVD